MMIEGMLADIGCESVTAAATVDKALALIGAQVFDTAMLDMNLNDNTRHSVAEALVALFAYCTANNGCILPTVGSAASISPTRCPTTRHSRSIVTPVSVTAAHVTPGHTSCEASCASLTSLGTWPDLSDPQTNT
jgi:CheY-like chemotaxis protein